MRLLAWDTSSKEGAVAAMEWDQKAQNREPKLVSEWALNVDVTHSERLLWAIDQVLKSARWALADVDLFAAGVGPGSFTGLRIGVTTARTLSHSLKKPLIGVSSLAAMARPAALALAQHKKRAVIVAATDACKGELFALWGSARSVLDCVTMADGDFAGVWKRGVEERVLPPEELMRAVKRKLSEGAGAAWYALGEGSTRYPDAWKTLPRAKRIDLVLPFANQIQGRYVGLLAWEAFQAGVLREALSVQPRYLRASDAELKLKAGLLPKGPTRGD